MKRAVSPSMVCEAQGSCELSGPAKQVVCVGATGPPTAASTFAIGTSHPLPVTLKLSSS